MADTNKFITLENLAYNNEKIKDYIEEKLEGVGGGTYTNPGVQNAVGGVPLGYKFEDTPITEVLDKLFSPPYTKPTIAISLNSLTIYDKNDKASWPTIIKITATVTKKTEDIVEVSAYAGDTLIEKKTTLVKDGGAFTFNYVVPAKFETTTFKVECKDSRSTVYTTKKVTVVAQSYYGFIPKGTDATPVVVKALNPVLKDTKTYTYEDITTPGTDLFHLVYAYPKDFGALTSVKDKLDWENIQEYLATTIKIDNEDYLCYRGINAISVTDFIQKYK